MALRSQSPRPWQAHEPLGDGVMEELRALIGEDRAVASGPKRLSTPETNLCADILGQAITESLDRKHITRQQEARAWLMEEPGFTAREACEAVGVEYEAMMKVLRERWKA